MYHCAFVTEVLVPELVWVLGSSGQVRSGQVIGSRNLNLRGQVIWSIKPDLT